MIAGKKTGAYCRWLALGLVAACAPTAEEIETSLAMAPAGTLVADKFSVAGKDVPLPPGAWTVIGTEIAPNGERGYHTIHMLVRIEGKAVRGAVEIFTNIPIKKRSERPSLLGGDTETGWLTVRSCVRDDMHFLKVISNFRLGEQDCWWVNHRRMNGPRDTEHWTESRKFLAENGIRAPLDMVTVSFRLATEMDYLTVNYFFDPETSGIEPEQDVYWKVNTWDTSIWHPDQVKNDERKRKYVERLIAWGEGWHDKVKLSLGMK